MNSKILNSRNLAMLFAENIESVCTAKRSFMQKGKLEVLSPAGDAERLDAALQYGADAVYLSMTQFGMRTAPQNFDEAALALVQRGFTRRELADRLMKED